jgi:hypothetical protein
MESRFGPHFLAVLDEVARLRREARDDVGAPGVGARAGAAGAGPRDVERLVERRWAGDGAKSSWAAKMAGPGAAPTGPSGGSTPSREAL